MPESVFERGVLGPDVLTRSEVMARRGKYRVVWRADPRVPEDKRYAVQETFLDDAVYDTLATYHLESAARRDMAARPGT